MQPLGGGEHALGRLLPDGGEASRERVGGGLAVPLDGPVRRELFLGVDRPLFRLAYRGVGGLAVLGEGAGGLAEALAGGVAEALLGAHVLSE